MTRPSHNPPPSPPPLLPTSPTPTSSPFKTPTPPLAAEINARTRTIHHNLNRLIIARLPLALPPYAPSPLPFEIGLIAFESLFLTVEDALSCPEFTQQACLAQFSARDRTLREKLVDILPAGLHRRERLQADLKHLAGLRARSSRIDFDWRALHILRRNQQLLRFFGGEGRNGQPHLLLAWTWVLYMAVFSGGRYIRTHLASAPACFWVPQSQTRAGYSFLYFDGEDAESSTVGDSLKEDFKARFADVESLLTGEEREEVVQEARRVFEVCEGLVGETDSVVAGLSAGQMKEPGSGLKDERSERVNAIARLGESECWSEAGHERWRWIAVLALLVLLAWKVARFVLGA